MRKYEGVVIIDPEKTDEQVTKTADEIKAFIEKEGGSVDHVDQWGKKKLAYTVKKRKYGFYTLFVFSGTNDIVLKLERLLKHNESIIKYITLKYDPRSSLKPTSADASSSYKESRY